jgi:hypothetical protein
MTGYWQLSLRLHSYYQTILRIDRFGTDVLKTNPRNNTSAVACEHQRASASLASPKVRTRRRSCINLATKTE